MKPCIEPSSVAAHCRLPPTFLQDKERELREELQGLRRGGRPPKFVSPMPKRRQVGAEGDDGDDDEEEGEDGDHVQDAGATCFFLIQSFGGPQQRGGTC